MLQFMINTPAPRPSEIVLRNIPPHVMRRLQDLAIAHQRTLQDELYAILEAAVTGNENPPRH